MKTLRIRLTAVAATGLLLAAPVAFAPSAAAIAVPEGEEVPVIETGDGYEDIVPLGAVVNLGEEGDIENRDEDGNLVDPADPEGIDRSDLARTPIVDEDGDGYEDIMPLEGGAPLVDEDGDGYEDITPLDGGAEIEPISADVEDEGGSATGWIIGGVTAAAVVGAGAVVLARRRATA